MVGPPNPSREKYPMISPSEAAPELQQLLAEVVRTIRAELKPEPAITLPNGKLAVDEKEAAALLSLNSWQLRDLRRSGQIECTRIVGGRVRYTADHLREYLARGHEPPAGRNRRKPA